MYTVCTYRIYHEGTKAAMECTLETKQVKSIIQVKHAWSRPLTFRSTDISLHYKAKSSSQRGCDPRQTGFKMENQTKISMQKYEAEDDSWEYSYHCLIFLIVMVFLQYVSVFLKSSN